MELKRNALLQIPQGTEAFFLEEAQHHHAIRSRLGELFASWNYLPIQTPVFDFFDSYATLLPASTLDLVYRLFDRDGALLMLRSDITLFLAKQMGVMLKRENLPLRLWYADTILRHQDREDISHNEFFQAGAELIGASGLFADLEILTLCMQSIEQTDAPACFFHLGSRALFLKVFGALALSEQKALREAVRLRERRDFLQLCAPLPNAGALADLFFFIGEAAERPELARLAGKALGDSAPAMDEVRHLCTMTAQLEELEKSKNLRLDLSEVGSQEYHTGIVFQAYVSGIDAAVASGGRYDTLLARFGYEAPAVGFSIMMRKLERLHRDQPLPPRAPHEARAATFSKAHQQAEAMRRQGKIAVACPEVEHG